MMWDTATIGEVCQIISGSTPSTKVADFWGGPFNWVTPAELTDDVHEIFETQRKVTQAALDHVGLKLLPRGTVLLSSRAPIGKVAIAGTEMYCNQGFKSLICNKRLNNKFLFWYLKTNTDFLQSLGRGATFKEISRTIVSSIRIPLPPVNDQKRIAHLLDTVDDLIQTRKKNLQNLDTLLQSVFHKMFGNPVRNEKGWEKGTIRDIVKSTQYGTSRPATPDGEYIYLRMNNITYEGNLNLESIKYINVPDKDFNKYSVSYGDILFNRTNSKELVGKTCVFKCDTPMIIAGYIIRIRIKKNATPEYLSAILNSAYGKKILRGMCKSIVGQANINAQEVQKIPILIPPIDLQNKFTAIVEKVEDIKSLYKESLAELENLYGVLSQKAFRGDLDLTRVPLPVEIPPTEVSSPIAGPATTAVRESSPFSDTIAKLLEAVIAADFGTAPAGNGVGTSSQVAASLVGGTIAAVIGGALAGVAGTTGAAVMPSLGTTMVSLAATALGLFTGFGKFPTNHGRNSPLQHANNESFEDSHSVSITPEIFAQRLHQVLYASLENISDKQFTSQDILTGLKQGCESYQPQIEILEELLRSNWIYEVTKLWIFDALAKGHIQQFFNDQENTVSFRRVGAQ